MKKILILSTSILLFFGLFGLIARFSTPALLPIENPSGTALYQANASFLADVRIFSEMPQVSHLEMTPDGQYLLVGTLQGTIWVYQKVNERFQKQSEPFFRLQTAQPGFPPEEAGLTGIALGADFDQSGDVFLLYSFAQEKRSFRNRVTRVTFTKQGSLVLGKQPIMIFEANTPGTGSHQIQDGIGVLVSDIPHLLFTVGEGFVAEQALDVAKEAGKLILIQRDGTAPIGARPFPDSKTIQAIGIRNAPAIARNMANNFIAIADTGPNNFDRFLYGTLLDTQGNNTEQLSFNWDGTEDSLQKEAIDLYREEKPTMVLHRWSPTETAVNIAFFTHSGLPPLEQNAHYVLVTLFGRTGEKSNTPGKKIMLGVLHDGVQPTLELTPFIERTAEGAGKFGHPIGLAVDPLTRQIYFGDIMEGRIYQTTLQGRR